MEKRYTVNEGPKGGVEYRQWTGPDTFRTVSRYVAWPHLSEADRAKADTRLAERRALKEQKAQNDKAWRSIMRGG